MFYPDQSERDQKPFDGARRAAEALFGRKASSDEKLIKDVEAPGSTEPGARKPRILRALTPAPLRQEHAELRSPSPKPAEKAEAVGARRKRPESAIPASQVARIRTWLEYGMTVPEVARVYGVAISVVERLV